MTAVLEDHTVLPFVSLSMFERNVLSGGSRFVYIQRLCPHSTNM